MLAYLTVAEVAERHRCGKQTVRDAITAGRLAAFKDGRLLRISPEALAAYEAACSTKRA